MPIAFVLINVEAGSENEVIQELKTIANVRDVYFVYGVYDLVAKIEAETQLSRGGFKNYESALFDDRISEDRNHFSFKQISETKEEALNTHKKLIERFTEISNTFDA